jgi:hypothetical protein
VFAWRTAAPAAGFELEEVTERTIEADGAEASEEAAADRLRLLHDSLAVIFGGRPTFNCCWTYISVALTP